jgi:glutamate--cysteine ligase
VRPRGRYLEVRFLDVQPEDRVGDALAALGSLVYDDEVRRRALATLEPQRTRLGDLWRSAAAGAVDTAPLPVRAVA